MSSAEIASTIDVELRLVWIESIRLARNVPYVMISSIASSCAYAFIGIAITLGSAAATASDTAVRRMFVVKLFESSETDCAPSRRLLTIVESPGRS